MRDAMTPSVPLTLPATGIRAISAQAVLLLTAAFVLPALAHAAGLPVRLLLPMHWPVILAGLCYGWRSGLVVGLAAPTVSFLLSGHPNPVVLPAMTLELGAYGALAGVGIQQLGLSRPLATLFSALGGRVVFIFMVVATGAFTGPFLAYLQAALVPGLIGLVAQVIALPSLAAWWVRRESPPRR
jgi:niacin transporter